MFKYVGLLSSLLIVGCSTIDQGIDPNAPVSDSDLANNAAYIDTYSVEQGGSLTMYVSSDMSFNVKLQHMTLSNIVKWSGGPYTTHIQDIPNNPWIDPLNWDDGITINIGENYESGWYQLFVTYENGDYSLMQFVVKEDDMGSTSTILVLDNATTRAAYNSWGNRSTYGFSSQNGQTAKTVNLYRPDSFKAQSEHIAFARWAKAADIPLEYASSIDWHNDPTLFSNYDLIVIVEHSEYWTKEMRDAVDAHLEGGGNFFSMSGNTAWWQVRIEEDVLVAYKWGPADPMYGIDNSLVTSLWSDDIVNNPENSTIGVSYRSAGYVNASGFYLAKDGYGGYDVKIPDHPLFEGTELKYNDSLGQAATIVGYETDGAEFTEIDGVPIVTGNDGTPPTLEILATSPAKTKQWEGTATMVAGTIKNGKVVNVATVDWADGLWKGSGSWGHVVDPQVAKVTLNIIEDLAPGSGAACNAGCHPSDYNDADNDGVDDKCDKCVITPGDSFGGCPITLE